MLKQFARDGSLYAIGAVVSRGLTLFTVPAYTHFLNPADFGVLDLILTAGVLLTLVVALEVGQGLAREWSTLQNPEAQRAMAGTAMCFTAMMHTIFLMLALPFSASLSEALFHTADRTIVVQAGLVFIALNAVYIQSQAQFRWSMQPLNFVTISAFYGLLTLVLGYGLGSQWGVVGVLIGQSLAAASVVAVSLWILRNEFDWTINKKYLRSMLVYSLPLAPAGIAIFFTFHANRFILNAHVTLDHIGHYSVASKVSAIVALLTVGIQTALTPLIYRHHTDAETPKNLARLLEYFIAAALVLSLSISLYARELILLISGPEYLPGYALVSWLVPATLLSQMYVFFPGLALARRTVTQLLITILIGFIALSINLFLVPIAQGKGAAISNLLSAALYIGIWAWKSQKFYKLPLRMGRISLAIIIYIFLLNIAPIINTTEQHEFSILITNFFLIIIMFVSCKFIGIIRTK